MTSSPASKPGWQLPERIVTPEKKLVNRRQILKAATAMACGAAGLRGIGWAAELGEDASRATTSPAAATEPAIRRNSLFTVKRPITEESFVTSYNNFIEFSFKKEGIAELAERFVTRPWQVEVGGLVEHALTFDVDELVSRMPLEERVYRFRCVEAWSFVVPWTGFPLSALLALAKPLPRARYVRFVSFNKPDQAPIVKALPLPWPYTEGLTLAEAMHDLTFVVTGMYGHDLTKQNGAPLRLAVPWKHGYKGAKSIVRIDLVEHEPTAFWSHMPFDFYDFVSNVDPTVTSLPWPQDTERVLDTGEWIPTRPYNGYGEWVAGLYE